MADTLRRLQAAQCHGALVGWLAARDPLAAGDTELISLATALAREPEQEAAKKRLEAWLAGSAARSQLAATWLAVRNAPLSSPPADPSCGGCTAARSGM